MNYPLPILYPRRLYKDVQWQDEYGAAGWSRVVATRLKDAEVISSEIGGKAHSQVLDIDIPAALVPSSTPGHFHLFLEVPMSWRQYKRMLKAMAKAGVLEEGYVKASIRRKHTAVRVPWLKKEN